MIMFLSSIAFFRVSLLIFFISSIDDRIMVDFVISFFDELVIKNEFDKLVHYSLCWYTVYELRTRTYP